MKEFNGFQKNDVIIIKSIIEHQFKWSESPESAFEIDVVRDNTTISTIVPSVQLLGMVVPKSDTIKNQGTDKVCVNHVGNTLYDFIKCSAPNEDEDLVIPSKIKLLERLPKASRTDSLTSYKQGLNEKRWEVSFDQLYNQFEYLPTAFSKGDEKVISNNAWLIEVE